MSAPSARILDAWRTGKATTGRWLRALLGDVAWRAPPWLRWSGQRLKQALAWVRNEPRRAAGLAGLIVVVLGAAYAGWRWYEGRPKPVLTEFMVTAPPVTCYACDPPGKPNPLVVVFADSAAPLEHSGKDLDPAANTIQLSPAIAGRWHWNDDRTLSFQPQEDWPVGETFEVRMARGGLVGARIRLKDYRFEFRSPAFEARISDTVFHQDPVVARNKKVVATVTFSHPVAAAELEKRIRLTLFNKLTDTQEEKLGETPFTVVYDKLRLKAHIHSAELAVPPKAGRLAIRIEPGVRAASGGNQTREALQSDVAVPGLNSLRVEQMSLEVAHDERNEPSQVLIVNLSFSVPEQALPPRLKAWLLPLRHPDPQRQAEVSMSRPYPWSERTVTRAVLDAAEPIDLSQIAGEREHYELHSFRHKAEPGRFIYVQLEKGLESFGGYVLGDTVERVLRVPEYPKEVRITQAGSLLAMSGQKTLTVLTRDVPALRIEVARLLPRQIQHLVTQTGGSFSEPRFQSWAFDAANITELFATTVRLPKLAPGTAHYQALDLGDYLHEDGSDRRGIFLLKLQAWDADANRSLSGYSSTNWNAARGDSMSDARLIVITDLGLLAKRSLDGSQEVFVQSIRSGEPLADVNIQVIGRNGLPVVSGNTDARGHVRFGDLSGFQREQQPVLYLARRGGDSSYLPLEERGRGLDLSRFEVGGVDNRVDQGTLAAYLFSDRGLYRPGEEIRIGAIVRSQDWRRGLTGVPLRVDVLDPRGVVVQSETFVPGAAGFGEIRHATRETSPAGNYTVSLSIVRNKNRADLIGSVTVQVRDFLPDRLRMSARFSGESAEGWVSPDGLKALVNLQNLFGTPAQNRRVTARLSLSPSFPSFRNYPDYQFFDPQAAREGFNEQLTDASTDADGNASFDLNLQRFARATYRVHIAAEGFEADGGRGVSSEAAQLVSNLPFLIGYKTDGDLEYVSGQAPRIVELIAIDPQARKTAVSGLKLARLETRYVSTLIRQDNGTYQYESRRKETRLSEQELTITASGLKLTLATDTPGSFAYVVLDREGQKLARVDYSVAGTADLTRSLEKNAELQIALARPDYAPGEEIEMQIQAPYTGSGLITIERDRVYTWRWFRTTTTSSVQHIRLPPGIEGNAYVSVAFVRDPASEEIYTSPLSYGVKPFSINLDARRNAVKVEAAPLVKPGEKLSLRYSSERPARIVVFAVDEGILQVARYKTPDPLGHFFQKRALEVSTLQILDLILPEFRKLALAAAPGGDAEGALGRNLNPFRRKGDRPVAYWSGILDSDSSPRELSYTVPDYFNGSLRLMAVAVSDEAIGVHESRTLVRGDFVLSPNAPTTVTPGDEFEVSVGVANNLAGSGAGAKIAVALQSGPGLEILGEAQQQLTIAEGREGSARFRLRARDVLGPAMLQFTAGSGQTTAHRRIDLSVRPATPYMTTLIAGHLDRGTREQRIDRNMYPEHRTLEAGISVLPLGLAHGLTSYLGNYPYSCTEQLVSQAMPAVVLGDRPEFGYVRQQPGADLAALIGELRMRQNDDGAYRLWPGGNDVEEFVSLYAQHFLLEASERGQTVPPDLLERGNQYLRGIAARDGNNLTDERHSAYAIYLLTRQGQLMSAQIAGLRKRLAARYAKEWEQDVTAAWLAGALQLMRQEGDAASIMAKLKFGAATPMESYYDAMTRDAEILQVLARHFPERLGDLPPAVMSTLAEKITQGSYHSLSAGTTLLALDVYARNAKASSAQLGMAAVLRDRSVKQLGLPAGLFPKVDFSGDTAALRFSNGSELNAWYLVNQSGFDRQPPREAISRGFEILREYSDAAGKPLTRVEMGQEIDVHLRFRGLSERAVSGVALVDLLPGGFELVIPREANAQPFFQAPAVVDPQNPVPEQSPQAAYSGWVCQICIGRAPASLRYGDLREDRVVFYAAINRELQEIVYRIKATNVGRYVVPPAYGEAMYDRSLVARSAAGSIEVARP